MHAEAYARARRLLSDRRGAVITAGILGVVHSLLVLALLLIVGLLTSLLVSLGEARYPAAKVTVKSGSPLPDWVAKRATGIDRRMRCSMIRAYSRSSRATVTVGTRSMRSVLAPYCRS